MLKCQQIAKRIREFLIGNLRLLIHNLLNQLLYYGYKRTLPFRCSNYGKFRLATGSSTIKGKCSKSSRVCFLKQSG